MEAKLISKNENNLQFLRNRYINVVYNVTKDMVYRSDQRALLLVHFDQVVI